MGRDIMMKHGDFNDRSIIGNLIDLSENETEHELNVRYVTVPNDWNEAVSGWNVVTATAKYQAVTRPKKKKGQSNGSGENKSTRKKLNIGMPSIEAELARAENADFLDFDACFTPEFGKRNQYAQAIRCVGDDFITPRRIPAWKAHVEPGTYRYIPNNGAYRHTKYQMHAPERNESTHHHKLPKSWRRRQVQKDIQRELRKEFGKQKQKSATSEKDNSTRLELMDLSRERSKSDGTLQYHRSSIDHDQVPYPLPISSADVPLASGDKFIEQFSSRLSALDEEIRRDAKLFRRSRGDEDSKGPLGRGRIKDSKIPPQAAEALTQETFSIRPLRTKSEQLRPLEKVTPQQRIAEDLSKLSVAQLKYTTASGGDAINLPTMEGGVIRKRKILDATCCKHILLGTGKLSIEDAMKTTKVTPNNKYSITGRDIPTKMLDSDRLTTALQTHLKSPEHRSTVERDYSSEIVAPETVSRALFPGICGKQMEVTFTTSRLL